MPSLGADMESGTLVEWKVSPGDRVKRGDLIATVETVKGAIDVEVFIDGIVETLVAQPGAQVPVGAVLAQIRTDGEAPEHVRVSPAAKKAAAQLGVQLSAVSGSGPGGAITLSDVEAAAPLQPPPAAVKPPFDRTASMRQAIAAAMTKSKREIPHYYLATELELSGPLAWLEKHNRQRPVAERLLPAALLLMAVVRAIKEVPEMNGSFGQEQFRPSEVVNLGVAISLRGGGLFAPAILGATALSLTELMARLTELAVRARAANLRSSELGSGTITVSNLGELGVDVAFPVILPPQVAMVGFGRIRTRPWVVDGQVVARPVVTASLAADHRVTDGHRGGKFLAAIDRLLQQPERL